MSTIWAEDATYMQDIEDRLWGKREPWGEAMESYHFDNHTGPSHMCMEDACAYVYDLRVKAHMAGGSGLDRGFAQNVQFLRGQA